MNYDEYLKFKADTANKREIYERLRHLQETNRNVGITPEAWNEIDTNWQKVESQVSAFFRHFFLVVRSRFTSDSFLFVSAPPLAMASGHRTSR